MEVLIQAVISPFFSSISTIIAAQALKSLNPLATRSFGAIFASVVLFVILTLNREKINIKSFRSSLSDILKLILLRPLIGNILLVYGLSLTSGIKAIFFTKVEPYFVLIWSWILRKEKITPKHVILLFFHIVGAIILSTGDSFKIGKTQIGDMLIIVAMMFLSLSYFYAEKVSKKFGARKIIIVTEGITGVILLPLIVLFIPSGKYLSPDLIIPWFYMAVSVLLFFVLSLTLWYSSLKSVKGWMVSALRSVGPILGAPVAWLVFGQKLTPVQIGGGLIVLITSTLIAYEHLKNKNKATK